jgi:magnesium transporter
LAQPLGECLVSEQTKDKKTLGLSAETQPDSKTGMGQWDPVRDLHIELEDLIVQALDANEIGQVEELIEPLHYADVADLLERLNPDDRNVVLGILGDDKDLPEIISELDESVRDDVIDDLGLASVAAVIQELESDDAVRIVEELEEHEQREVLDAIPASDRTLIEESLSFLEDSAGRLMQREIVTVPEFWNVGQTIDFLRQSTEDETLGLPEIFYDIFVVDPSHMPIGTISLSRLLRTKRPVKTTDIMEPEMHIIPVRMDQEDVAFIFRQRDLTSAPVVDESGRLVGAITIDDVVDVIHEEIEEDIMRLGGVREDDLYEAAMETTRSRFSWLLVNLGTAIVASIVISLFEGTLEEIVAVAILMPIVASMGGNAGTQTMTVTVRALAMKELSATNSMRVVWKEILVGGVNGIVFAVLAGIVAWLWFGNVSLGIVIAMAMVVNMIVAGIAGTTIPLLLDRAGADPAVASGVFLTTITDVVGFAAFLGLAAVFLF